MLAEECHHRGLGIFDGRKVYEWFPKTLGLK